MFLATRYSQLATMNRFFLLPILLVLTSVCWADSPSENEPYVPSNTENPPAAAPAQPTARKSVIPNLKGDALKDYSKELLKKWARVRDKGDEDDCRQAAREYIGAILALAKDDVMDVNSKRVLDDQIKTRLRSLKATIGAYNKQRRMARLAAENAAKKAAGIPIRPQSIKPRQNNNQNDGILAQQGDFANILGENAKTSNYEKEGEELVELIQKTVCIDTWEINGGNGTIYYYGPMKAMVVNQTAEVHEEIAQVLEQLRRAGN